MKTRPILRSLALVLALFTLMAFFPVLATVETPITGEQTTTPPDTAPPADTPPAESPGAPEEGEPSGDTVPEPVSDPLVRFPDAQDHWAADTLRKAYLDGLLSGFADGTMRPDAEINRGELVTILVRLLHAQTAAPTGSLPNIRGDEWYAQAAYLGAYLGLVDKQDSFTDPFLRVDAFALLNSAFQLRNTTTLPDYSAYKEMALLSYRMKAESGYLLKEGYIHGYDGRLEPYKPLSRAEFVTILYRIVPNLLGNEWETVPSSGGSLLSGDVTLTGTLAAPIWVDCEASSVQFTEVTAGKITVQSQKINSFTFSGQNQIGQLTLAGGNGKDFIFSTEAGTTVDNLIVGDHQGAVIVNSPVKTLMISGKNQSVTLKAPVENLIVSGENCSLTLNASIPVLHLYGSAKLQGKATIALVNDYSGKLQSSEGITITDRVDQTDQGIRGIAIHASAPQTLAVEAPLTLTATVKNPVERQAVATWLMDGKVYHTQAISIGPNGTSYSYTFPVEYSHDMKTDRTLSFVVTYEYFRGSYTGTAKAETKVTLENYSQEYYNAQMLQTVTTGYKGNYTLAWAEANDYNDYTKEHWINSKGYSSNTQYIIWINLTYQRVNIFEGSAGNWTLIRSHIVGTGRPERNTPTGIYTVTARKKSGWTTATYNVRPVTNFTNSSYSEMAFHSRIYNPSHTRLTDARIGFPISDGCIRMYDEDAWWIFENIPNGTKVVVY